MTESNVTAATDFSPARSNSASPPSNFRREGSVQIVCDFAPLNVMDIPEGSRSLFNSATWIGVIQDTYGFKLQASTLRRLGQVEAAILFVEVDDIRGRRILSLPFSDYCDPFVDSPETWHTLVSPILELGAPVRFRTLRSELPTSDQRFDVTGNSLWHGVDLNRPEDEIWATLRDNARQNIRKAERGSIVVREGRTLEDVITFYRMHSSLRKDKYRMFAQPFSFFEHIHTAFAAGGRLIVLLAEQDGIAIAGTLFIVHDNTLYYKFNASRDTALRPNDLLVWTGIKVAQRAGLSRLDFGVSDIDQPGLIRFKRKFATEERTVSYTSWLPPGHNDPRAKESGRLLSELTGILTSSEVDDRITRSVGDIVYRYFC
jgi:CelD/BcsL family acetyltransferase involved in cellulose biosynthesis